jgi:L-lactate dehydrogenase complex protein LldG
MSAISDSRAQMLERIRTATQNSATTAEQRRSGYAAMPREYVQKGKLTGKACRELFIERLREYDAEVVGCTPEELDVTIAAQLKASGRRKFVAPAGLPAEWLVKGFDWRLDDGLSANEVEQVEGVVTACFCGVADSGTIVLHHGSAEGRRVISLLPDWHLCMVRASQIVETLPEYFARCEVPPAIVTWISGPSATADIEMTRIKGVHGPRFLNVVLVHDAGNRDWAVGNKDIN